MRVFKRTELKLCVSNGQGLDATNAKLDLISNVIRQTLNINCAVLMGANIAGEVALEHYCETTIGQSQCSCSVIELSAILCCISVYTVVVAVFLCSQELQIC